jgi:hypothetical protein
MDGDVGAHVPLAVARTQVTDGQPSPEDEPTQRDDGQRHVEIEDLLHEALVGVERGVEEHERERDTDRDDGGKCEAPEPLAVSRCRGH